MVKRLQCMSIIRTCEIGDGLRLPSASCWETVTGVGPALWSHSMLMILSCAIAVPANVGFCEQAPVPG